MHKGSNISKNKKASADQSQGCCRGLNNCMTMGSIVSTNINNDTHPIQKQQKPYSFTNKFEQQVFLYIIYMKLYYHVLYITVGKEI